MANITIGELQNASVVEDSDLFEVETSEGSRHVSANTLKQYATEEVMASLGNKVDKVPGKDLSTNDFTNALRDKLAALEGSHWRGTFVSVAALEVGVVDPVAGDYADVDVVGEDVQRYIWDASDAAWVVQSGAVAPITRAKLADQFSFNSVMTSGDLNAQRLPEGSYIVGTSVTNRPPGVTGGNAALKVIPVGNWDIQEISSIANPEQIFRRVFRFDNGAFGEWIPFGAGGGGGAVVPDGSITRSKLAAGYGYNSIISTGSLNQQRWNEGSYLVSTGVADRPAGMSGGNAGLLVTHMGAWNQETIVNIDRPEQRFTRISRFSNGSFPPWIPTGETMGGNTNRLLGKTIAFLGDSITASSAGFPGKIGVMLGANIINCGIGGTRMGVHTVNGYDRLSGWTIASAIESNDFSQVEAGALDVGDPGLMTKVNLMKDTDWQSVDYIVVGFGTNDFGGDRQLGLPTDTTEESFYGACDMVMSKLQRACPQARLLFLTPIWRRRTPTHTGGVVGGSDISPNTHGLYLYEFGEVIQEVCKRYHLECLELYYTSGIAEATNLQYLEDELHPNAAGYELMASKVAGALSSRW